MRNCEHEYEIAFIKVLHIFYNITIEESVQF